jgi:hypothetical protein
VYEVATGLPSVDHISGELAMNTLRRIIERRLDALPLTERDRRLLTKAASHGPFRLKDCRQLGFSSSQALYSRVKRLVGMSLLQPEHAFGRRSTVYRTAADVNILFGAAKTFKKQGEDKNLKEDKTV